MAKRIRFTKEDKEKIMQKTGCRCAHCGIKLDIHEATIEHMVPINKGGLNDEYNMVVLCEKCNTDKSNYVHDIFKYYPYILDEYRDNFSLYHSFVRAMESGKSIFGIEVSEYKGYAPEHKELIYRMYMRGAHKRSIESAVKMLGIRFELTKAYEGDAEEIMKAIDSTIENKNFRVNKCYYKNEYMVINDIQEGEVYVLRQVSDNKIHGVFGFKKIDEDTLLIPQLQAITMTTNLRPVYAMTTAVVDVFAIDCFEEIMDDIMSNMLTARMIPVYFDILGPVFSKKDECIFIPYKIDGVDVSVEFLSIKFIKDIIRLNIENAAKDFKYKMPQGDVEMFTDMMLSYREMKELKEDMTPDEESLLNKYPEMSELFVPETCSLYGAGM